MSALSHRLRGTLDELRAAGTYKLLRHLTAPMAPVTQIAEIGEVLVFCSNNYLGLANHPEVVEAGIAGLKKYGAGTASVRFICGTFDCHLALEDRIARFLGTEAALTYVSCWNANEGLITNLVQEGDAIVSDELNHASIIDATRLARQATRKVYAHSDLDSMRSVLGEVEQSPVKIVVTDGVFSMEGDIAKLPELTEVCREHGATLVVDDSHGTGVLGQHGRGVHEHFGITATGPAGVDVFTGTLGKALGGAAGGYVAGPREVIDYLIQRSRPQLFSNALPPTVACSAAKALEILEREPERVTRLHQNVAKMRSGLQNLGFEVLESPTAILPIIVGDTAKAIRLSEELLKKGVFVIGFGFPVVPEGAARLRIQMSAAHTDEHIERALKAFSELSS
ncbi:MAG: glycine C-acetyltransferase [Planctomycetaceae bacterium]|nr:glycine C-acetyltransferase [Planctomycetales bacterium]MCB9874960.1 glycine C-acetyltransferase [Planctomycetaceae bacterium]MCB9939385.1 glycine C-acetyltransferase [Planctomycetaceae bacterium]